MPDPARIRVTIANLRLRGGTSADANALAEGLKSGLASYLAANPGLLNAGIGQPTLRVQLPQNGTARQQGQAAGARIGASLGAPKASKP